MHFELPSNIYNFLHDRIFHGTIAITIILQCVRSYCFYQCPSDISAVEASHTDQLRVTEYVQIILRDTDDRIEKCQKKIKLLKKLASQQNVNVSPVAGKFGVQSPDQLSERLQEYARSFPSFLAVNNQDRRIQFSYRYFLKSHGWKEEPSWLDRWLRWDDSISQDYKQLREMTLVLEGQIEVRSRLSRFAQLSHQVSPPSELQYAYSAG